MYDWSKHPRFIVYALVDPQTDLVRYIGASTMGPARPLEHATRVARERTHKAAWIRSLLQEGLKYKVVTLETCPGPAEMYRAEIRWIAEARRQRWPLTNHTTGGEGASVKKLVLPTDEIVRRYMAGESEKALANAYGVQRWTIRRRLVEGGAEIRNRSSAMYLRMQQTTPEQRKQLAQAANTACRGKPRSDEARVNMRAAQRKRRGLPL